MTALPLAVTCGRNPRATPGWLAQPRQARPRTAARCATEAAPARPAGGGGELPGHPTPPAPPLPTPAPAPPAASAAQAHVHPPLQQHHQQKQQQQAHRGTVQEPPQGQPQLQVRHERGLAFVLSPGAFYRPESAAGRDLAVLVAALHRRRTGRLRVLDVMAASGVRGARYLAQAGADEVWVNDGDASLHDTMILNLCSAAGVPAGLAEGPPGGGPQGLARAGAEPGDLLAGQAAAQDGRGGSGSGSTSTSAATICATTTSSSSGSGSDESLASIVDGGAELVRQRLAGWEARAQRIKLEGLAREVRQWDWQSAAPPQPGGGTEASSSPGEAARSAAPPPEDVFVGRRIRVSHCDANRLLTNCYMRESYFDVIDVDSFGSQTMHLPAAIDAVKFGGLLFLTSTDGFTASGKRPERGLAAYGCYTRAIPWVNEQGLRMLIGAAVREAASRGVALQPVFSLYSPHGPVFRVMLRATRTAEWPAQHYGFVGHCFVHGDNYTLGWRSLGAAHCRCNTRGRLRGAAAPVAASSAGYAGAPPPHPAASAPGDPAAAAADSAAPGAPADPSTTPLVVAGPMWTGPLHDAAELAAMAAEASARGWEGLSVESEATPGRKSSVRPLRELLAVLSEEADPRLPPGFVSIDDSLSRRLARPPPRDGLIAALRAEGFAAARCHLEARALRTDACMEDILRVAEAALGIPRRPLRRGGATAQAATP